jgi:very-short-patch-repair endonuclease
MDGAGATDLERSEQRILIKASVANRINVAFHQNSIPLVGDIQIVNETDLALAGVEISVTSTPPFLTPKTFRLDHVAAGGLQQLSPVQIELNAAFLRKLTEAVDGEVLIEARVNGAVIAEERFSCRILAASEWTGISTAPELIAAFVRPNDPTVDAILRNAAEKLRANGRDTALDGYRGGKARAWEVAEAIWAALVDERIIYALPPKSFERDGQKVRNPGAILERKLATCLDLTLLYAACLEQAGLNALIGFSEGHAFCGLWLKPEEFPLGVVDEAQTIRKRIMLQDLVLVETTLLTSEPPLRFRTAVDKAKTFVEENAERQFELIVDVARARHRQIRALATDNESGSPAISVIAGSGQSVEMEAPPVFVDEEAPVAEPDEPLDRLERWKRKLLDLSLRNRLLNFKAGKTSIELTCPNAGLLEDKLFAGGKLKLLPKVQLMSGGDPRDAELHFRKAGSDAARQYALDALIRGDIHTNVSADELDDRLTEIYRTARNSFEEGGANSLHLAIGFISWTPAGKDQRCKSPLILMPVGLERRTIRSGFRLVRHDDDARINPTLLQMLRQDFKLVMPEFERDLPADASGLDVAQIWRVARQHLKDMKGFELTEEVTLANFSFTKYLMWKDLVERTEVLKRHPVVKHLIDTPKETFGDPNDRMPEEADLDYEVEPKSLLMPLLADSSQTAATLAADRGKNFVLFGPPGTGKSQTIANMVAHLVGSGRSVLFVSQKTTALEVVRKRLNDIGLGSFCLEVHSAKAQKSAVLGQLKVAWESRAAESVREWDQSTDDLKSLRNQLNDVVRALHRRHRNGWTAHEALGRVIGNRTLAPHLKIAFASADTHDEQAIRALREMCRMLRTTVDAIGSPSTHPLAGVRRTEWSPVWQNELIAGVSAFQTAALQLERASSPVFGLIRAPLSADPKTIYRILMLASTACQSAARQGVVLIGCDVRSLLESFAVWKRDRECCAAIAGQLKRSYSDGVFALNLPKLLGEWQEASASFFMTRNGRKKRVWDALAVFADGEMPDDVGAEIARLIDLAQARQAAARHDSSLSVFGTLWQGLATKPEQIDQVFAWHGKVREAAQALASEADDAGVWMGRIRGVLKERPELVEDGGDLLLAAMKMLAAYRTFDEARRTLVEKVDAQDAWLGIEIGDHWLIEASQRAGEWAGAAAQTQRWCAWQKAASIAAAGGLKDLIDALQSGAISSAELGQSFEVGYARWWIEQVVDADPVLRGFVSDQHEEAVGRFRDLDEKVAQLTRRVIAARLSGYVPARNAFGANPEYGILSREIEKRARQIPLRQLFSQMPTVMTRLAPCVMMSPLSIAQFLPAETQAFDVVVFDEASQIPVWDAVGAIARGKQVIVVGDPKQLPPTSFFDRGDDGYDDANEIEDLDSILDECLGANIPRKHLAWHYRSRHESLITFSNERYYEGRLVTFPSPVTEDRAVRYQHVPNGIYERGSGRVNREEARAVVVDVVRRLSDPEFALGQSSIGIVTFNTEQQRLIENLLDMERRNRPELERFFGPEWHEPVFVKNLENVQGDERDVILFSVAYGPDASGRVSATISTLNKDGGSRRLNVAITRARSALVVFATLRADQIDLSRTKAAGVRDFKHFLEFAEHGPRALAQAAAPLDRDTDSPFEDAVLRTLQDHGWTVHPQVGVSGFRIDLGVVHPDAPGRYLAGVECDGATYHRSATARDRDRLRERVLRDLGWRIHRVWSTDWWVDQDRALASLLAKLDTDLAQVRAEEAARAEERAKAKVRLSTSPPHPADQESSGQETDGEMLSMTPAADAEPAASEKPIRRYAERVAVGLGLGEALPEADVHGTYRVADLEGAGFSINRDSFYDTGYRPTLRKMVAHVIAVEGPIFEDVLVQRIARAHGFARAAGRIRETVLDVVEGKFPKSKEDSRTIFWPEGADPKVLPLFRAGSLEQRDHPDIPLVELAALAKQFIERGAEPKEAAVMIGQELGLGRLREAARERFEVAAQKHSGA